MTGPHPVPTVGTAGISSRILDQNGAQAVTVEGPIPICRYGPIGTRGAHGLRLMVRPQLIEAAERITADPFSKISAVFWEIPDIHWESFNRMSAGLGRAWQDFGRTSAGGRLDIEA